MYLCPLAILLVFAIGVIVLSFVLPRIRERREASPAFTTTFGDSGFSSDDALPETTSPGDVSVMLPDGEFTVLEVKGPEGESSEQVAVQDGAIQGTVLATDLSGDGGSTTAHQEQTSPVRDGAEADS
jgi:hypothetical protein